jgi:hypothetical protein
MNAILQKMIADDFLYAAIVAALPGRRRASPQGFLNIDCPMCVSRGEGADRRQRCGIKAQGGGLGINCFNCGFKTRWSPGQGLSRNLRGFLAAIGLTPHEIARLDHKAMTYRGMLAACPQPPASAASSSRPSFPALGLPLGAQSLEAWAAAGCEDEDFIVVAAYSFSRGPELAEATRYYWAPDAGPELRRRLIIPCWEGGRIVGWLARAVDAGVEPRYLSEIPTDLLFNADLMRLPKRKYLPVVEGASDALAVSGIGLLGARLNDRRAAWIKASGKQVILVPDRDRRGGELIDMALRHGWHVAFPGLPDAGKPAFWAPDVKDCAQAVER